MKRKIWAVLQKILLVGLLGIAGTGIGIPVGVMAQDVSNLRYPADPASRPVTGAAKGEVLNFHLDSSKIFPGTSRGYSVYIPANYNPGTPACLFISLDGIVFNAPTVFDNLIAGGEMPVTIGVFINPGAIMKNDRDVLRYNRSNEFDNTNNNFVRFILEELLPDVETRKSADGRAVRISKKAADRCICGVSSGGICAFTAAWERPDAFSRVFSAIGTFVGMRGGDQYPVLIRKTEPKPIRVFLQDGSQDAWNPLFGSWYTSNLSMEAALNFAGYEVAHAWGEGGHNGVQGEAIFPDVMRWLWKGWPAPVNAGPSANNMLGSILEQKEGWMPVCDLPDLNGGIEADARGGILFSDQSGNLNSLDSMGHRQVRLKKERSKDIIAAGPGGMIYMLDRGARTLSAYDGRGTVKRIGNKISGEGMLVTDKGDMYLTRQGAGRSDRNNLWLVRADGSRTIVDSDLNLGSALAIYPDKKMLLVNEDHSHWIFSYAIREDGTLRDRQRLYWLHNAENFDHEQPAGMVFDRRGNLYVATTMGVQVCDQNGRVRAILTLPAGPISAICLGGPAFDNLYVVCGNKLYRRRLTVSAAASWMPPVVPVSIGPG